LIFVTVGTQLAFDRLIQAVDIWAGTTEQHDVFAQIGPADYTPRHIEHERFISPAECHARMVEADVIVAHAGMGTILRALELGKPLLVMPRQAALGEHRNDHQLATAKRFAQLGRVSVAEGADDLAVKLVALDALTVSQPISPYASTQLISALNSFING
jgi:UDP-N-acetylglucosamine transferase subunit ALG13